MKHAEFYIHTLKHDATYDLTTAKSVSSSPVARGCVKSKASLFKDFLFLRLGDIIIPCKNFFRKGLLFGLNTSGLFLVDIDIFLGVVQLLKVFIPVDFGFTSLGPGCNR